MAHAQYRTITSTQEYLIASGRIAPDDSITLFPFYRQAYAIGTDDSPNTGSYSIELQDAQGNVLFTRFFDQQATESPVQGSPLHFFEVLPFPSGTTKVRIKHNTILLGEMSPSATLPQVTILTPVSGQTMTDLMEIQWQGSDADGDPLHYMVEYSIDGGNTWRTIGVDRTGTTMSVNTRDLPGTTQAKIRVLASDGFNTAIAESSLFAVAEKSPEVTIMSPQNGVVIAPGQWIRLSGLADDREDGPLDSALVWAVDGTTQIGVGRQLTLFELSPGNHRITLTATDSDGNISNNHVMVYIGYKIALPLSMR